MIAPFSATMHRKTLGVIAVVFALARTLHASSRAQIALEERVLHERNPTNYQFNASVDEVKAAVKEAFGYKWANEMNLKSKTPVLKGPLYSALQTQGGHLFWKGEGDALSNNLLIKPGNENDAYLAGNGWCVGLSQVYFREGMRLVYFADFHIHIAAISPSKTQVTIFTYGSSVVTGMENHVAHGPAYVFGKVPPTSIEEYQVLLRIGRELGDLNMPTLSMPDADSPVRKLKVDRLRLVEKSVLSIDKSLPPALRTMARKLRFQYEGATR
jgi:hypothetical protein